MDQYSTLILIALMVVAFYLLIMRPQRKRQQAIAKTLSELTPGTRVMLGSGLFGTVVAVGEKQVVLEISPGIELTVLKQAVARVVTADEEDVEFDELDDLDSDEVVEPDQPTVADLSSGSIQPEPVRPAVDPEGARSAADPEVEPPATGPGPKPTTAG
jgi:preprotein translocase subunit YajC